ncbi:MAG: choice-of-anchor tandem repeat NxxGxxAF-containing protein [Armatimonadota bacterium]
MKYRLLLGLLLVGGLFAALPARAANYTFTIIKDTRTEVDSLSRPAINASGQVAYWARIVGGGSGIFRGSGDDPEALVTSSPTGPFTSISQEFDLTSSGQVVFIGSRWNPNVDPPQSFIGLYTSSGGTVFDVRQGLSPNKPSVEGGVVAYLAGGTGRASGIFLTDLNGGVPGSPAVSTEDDSQFIYVRDPDLNFEGDPNNPTALGFSAAFYATYRVDGRAGPSAIVSYSNGAVSRIADTTDRFIGFHDSPANDGDVAYIGYLEGGRQEVYKNQTLIASTDHGYSNFQAVTIANGTVAFLAKVPSGWGIFTGPDPVADKVIATGDTLLGGTVQTVELSREGINDQGQIAFKATLAGGVQVIARANPANAPVQVEDVTKRVKVKTSGFKYSPKKKQYLQKVSVKNVSKQPITGPVSLVLDELSPVDTLVNASGSTTETLPAGSPYLDLNVGSDGVLAAGETAKTTLRFKKLKKKGKIKYTVRVLAGTGIR